MSQDPMSVHPMGDFLNAARNENHAEMRDPTRADVRDAVCSLRHGIADGCGEMVVLSDDEMRENARLSAAARRDDDDAPPLGFEARLRPLTARQRGAIHLLTMGKTVVATARSIKVDPGTIHRWKATNPLFIAELNRRQAAAFDAIVVKLRLAMERAVDEIHATVNGPSKRDRADAMWRLLPMLRPARLVIPNGPTTATAVIDAQVRARRAERGEVVEAEVTDDERLAVLGCGPTEERASMRPASALAPTSAGATS